MITRVVNRRLSSQLSHITTPIFYPNAKPHLGHLYSSLLCDVFHRWQLLTGKQSLFTTGTDEHGLKIQLASEKNNFANPRDFVDKLYKDFIQLDTACDIQFTRFIRTTDPDHEENVIKLWNLCYRNGYIYQGEHKGWYSVSDETFYPESKVVKDPRNDGKFINTETNNEVIYQSETNYFFKLSEFRERLQHLMLENPNFIYPEAKRQEISRELQNGMEFHDLSISRPSSRLKWGIDVPQDPTQKVYVWFDALCNYITSVGGIDSILTGSPPHYVKNTSAREWWQNTTHLIGKDIIKFHTIYWPSFLIAAGLPLPKQIVVHSHWLSNGVKMSKSLGNVVDPLLMIDHYGADAMRWFLLENSQLEQDGDFQENKLHSSREMLVSKWGNLINRCCSPKFNVHRAVLLFTSENNRTGDHYLAELFKDQPTIKTQIEQLISKLNTVPQMMNERLNSFQTRPVLRFVWSIIDDANTLMQNAQPWAISGEQQDAIIYLCMETSRILSILCQPIIPKLSANLLDRIDVSPDRRSLPFAKIYSDNSYGQGSNLKGREVPIQRILQREK